MQLPWLSANTWISMCRGRNRNFSSNTRSSPKAACASRRAPSSAGAKLSLASTARGRLDEDRKAELRRRGFECFEILLIFLIAGHDGHARTRHQPFGLDLRTHRADRRRRRANEHDTRDLAGRSKAGVLG